MELQGSPIIANKYVILDEIGRGKFGIVHKGEHIKHRTLVAIKMEPTTSEYNTIKYEATILNYLYNNGCRVIPSVLWYGIYSDYKCLTMDYYDQTIQKYLQSVKTKYIGSPIDYLKQVIKLITNMVGILEQVHKHQIIHRDIKPDNFMLKGGELHIIDFGIASAISNLEEMDREPNRDTVIGSPKYISYFVHQGYEPMYRDDLISVGYCFFDFLLGSLPWSNISLSSSSLDNHTQQLYPEIHILHEKNQVRKKWKEWKNIEKILDTISKRYNVGEIQDNPSRKIFMNMFEYFALCYNLQFEERPVYEELYQVLQKSLD
jgi:serine/threonine protein kinase